MYVDETKRAGYVIVAVTVHDPTPTRRIVRNLVTPGRRRLHMVDERPRNRGTIITALLAAPIQAIVYDAARRYPTDLAARAACLEAVVEDLAVSPARTRLVMERDDTLIRSDRHVLFQAVRRWGVEGTLSYDHSGAGEEPLLALPDVLAWCWARSSEWRRRIDPLLLEVRQV